MPRDNGASGTTKSSPNEASGAVSLADCHRVWGHIPQTETTLPASSTSKLRSSSKTEMKLPPGEGSTSNEYSSGRYTRMLSGVVRDVVRSIRKCILRPASEQHVIDHVRLRIDDQLIGACGGRVGCTGSRIRACRAFGAISDPPHCDSKLPHAPLYQTTNNIYRHH